MEQPNPQVSDRHEWALAVGRIVLAFSGIELMLLQILVNISPENEYERFRCSEFLPKANGARAAVENSQLIPRQRQKLLSVLGAVITNAKWRNLVAHTPIRLGLSDGAAGIEFRAEARSTRDQNISLTWDNLVVLADDIEGLEQNLYAALADAEFSLAGN